MAKEYSPSRSNATAESGRLDFGDDLPLMAQCRSLGLDVRGGRDAWAAFSKDGRYRYVLGRICHERKDQAIALFILHNPSKASVEDDPTVRRCIGFSRRWGMTGCLVINPFAFVATDPRVVVSTYRHAGDIVGGDVNRDVRQLALADPHVKLVVVGWGRLRVREWKPTVLSACVDVGNAMHETRCVGINADGSPEHPLFVSYRQDHRPFPAGNVAASVGMTGAAT